MAAATREGAVGEEADVDNPIVFFDITLGGEFLIERKPPFFSFFFFFPPPPLFKEDVCVCVSCFLFIFFIF